MEVRDSVDSDHHPVIVKLRAGGIQRTKAKKERRTTTRGNWTEQGRRKFREELNWRRSRDGKIEEDMEAMIEQFKRGLEKSREKEQRSKKKGWWDEECKKRKRELSGVLREWRKGRTEGESYSKAKREYNSLCKDKKREKNKRFIKEVEEARTDREVWRIVNRERKKREQVHANIKEDEWKIHFMNLLGGTEEKVVMGGERKPEEEEEGAQEEEINREEIRRAEAKLKDGKAVGGDGIPNEVWKYGGEEVSKWI
ncbi:vicilin-like seed storage protein At2g18540 [Osmia bicornis bicornis]|uniref:vicilin-like seed storage protein At2g18540 n=1 Tax=Osmia bicornis bicornis TaxID=1437191 RepID=UPI001EAF563B|nr:vicilin-like seed storage protein At2g18540 [Osmia bicornis bicornis]